MLKEEEQTKIRARVDNIIADAGYYLVDFRIGTVGRYPYIRVLVANEQHDITLDEVTNLTYLIRDDSIFNELLPDDYQLEVSSPGVDYPLKDWRDFPRNIGREMRVFHHSTSFPSPFKGKLLEANQDSVVFKVGSETRNLKINEIEYAKLILKF